MSKGVGLYRLDCSHAMSIHHSPYLPLMNFPPRNCLADVCASAAQNTLTTFGPFLLLSYLLRPTLRFVAMLPLISKSPAPPTQSSPPLFLSRSEESSQLPTSPKLGNPSTPPLSIPKKTRAELISLFLSPPSVMTNLSPCPTVNLATATFTLTTACTHDLLTLLDATIFLVDTRTTGSIEVDERENRTIAILTVECGDERMEELEREMAEGPSKWLLLNLDVQDHPRVLQERKYQRLIYEVKQLEEVSVPRSTGSGYGSGGNCGGSIRNDKMGRLGTATPKDARSSWRARAVTTMKNKLARGKNTKSADNSPVPPKSEVVRTPTKPITLEGSEHPAMFEKRHSKPTWSSKANPAKSFRKLTVLQANDEDGKHVYEVENTETKVRKSKIYMCGLF